LRLLHPPVRAQQSGTPLNGFFSLVYFSSILNYNKNSMKEKKKYLHGTNLILQDSQKEKDPYKIKVLGRDFIVLPNVFSPKYFFDTEFFAKEITIGKGEEFLEIGPGTGAVSVTMALKGAAKVVAIDINPDAVKNSRENAKLHKVDDIVQVFQGDLYSPLNENDKFDTIFWNTPFGYIEDKNISTLEKAVYDPGYTSTEKFITGAKKHLKSNGRLLIGFSSTLGHLSKLKELLKTSNYQVKLIAEIQSKETHPVKFELFEAKLR